MPPTPINKQPMTKDLTVLRKEIDAVDEQLLLLIDRRVGIAREIGQWKREHDEPVIQAQRYQEVLNHYMELGASKGLSEDLVRAVFEALHKESVRVEL